MSSIEEHFPEWSNCTIQFSEKEEAELAGIRALSVTNSTTDDTMVFFDDKEIEPVNIELTDGENISKCFNPNKARTEEIDDDDDCGTATLSSKESDEDVPELVDNSSDEDEDDEIPPLVDNLAYQLETIRHLELLASGMRIMELVNNRGEINEAEYPTSLNTILTKWRLLEKSAVSIEKEDIGSKDSLTVNVGETSPIGIYEVSENLQ